MVGDIITCGMVYYGIALMCILALVQVFGLVHNISHIVTLYISDNVVYFFICSSSSI